MKSICQMIIKKELILKAFVYNNKYYDNKVWIN